MGRKHKKLEFVSKENDRNSLNFVNFLLTCLVLIFVIGASDGGNFVNHFNRLGENLDKALSDVVEVSQPNYTDVFVNVTLLSDAKYNAKGMGGLYNITHSFIRLILPNVLPPNHILQVENNNLRVNVGEHWHKLLVQYSGLLGVSIVILLFGVLMPLCGIFFCFCRCCGRCGARSRPYDKKYDLCKKCFFGTLLIGCCTLLLFGVVCAFVSNQHVDEGVQDLPKSLRKAAIDTNNFLDATNFQASVLLKKNFREFDESIGHTLDNCSMIVFRELENMSNATSIDSISEIAEQFPKIREDYQLLKDSTNELRVYASQLNDAVRKIKRDLLDILKNCVDRLEQCRKLNDEIGTLKTNIDFNKLPDINTQIRDLDEILSRSDIDDIGRGKAKLESIQTDIQRAVKDNTNKARQKIAQAGEKLAQTADDLERTIDDFKRQINRLFNRTSYDKSTVIDHWFTEEYVVKLEKYRYYTGIAVSCILLLVTIFLALGLICGICGKRPDGYGDDCCNKGSGSQFLICSVLLMFFFTTLIAAATLIYFFIGVVSHQVVCVPARHPQGSEIFKLVDRLNFSSVGIDDKLSEILTKCHRNETLYEVFSLKRHFDLDRLENYMREFDINRTLHDLSKSRVNFDGFSLLNASQLNTLRSISQSSFADIDFDKFKEELAANFTNTDFRDIGVELEGVIAKVQELALIDPNAKDLEESLGRVLVHVNFYQEKLVKPMQETAMRVIETASSLEAKLHLGHSNFQEGMAALISKVEMAQRTLRNEGPNLIKSIATNFASDIIEQVEKYLQRVVLKSKTEVGKCGPLSYVINATITSTCDRVMQPINGFWFCLFCSMIVFIPTIVISVKLSTLYQKQLPFDAVPLEAGRRAKGKKKSRAKRYEDRPGLTPNGIGDAPPRAAGSTQQETRYADMSLKNWEEFPAGGPPQYQRAPTEYERPPPYYFPGSGDQP